MKIVVAPQAFKGTASAITVANAIVQGIRFALPEANIIPIPIADGGAGTVDTLVASTNGHYVHTPTTDPIGRSITGTWGVLGDRTTAIIEVAAASGLSLVNSCERDPNLATTRGTGDLIRAALDADYRNILIGLGDSATNDGGVGLAQTLGIRFLDREGDLLPPKVVSLVNLRTIDMTNIHPKIRASTITALCDVNNPLCGPNGASIIFGPQKGANEQQIQLLEGALEHFANIIEQQFHIRVHNLNGTGAAGGVGATAVALLKATLEPGFDVISKYLRLTEALIDADIVVTGEGRIDSQTIGGKGVQGIANLAREHRVPIVAAITGQNTLPMEATSAMGIDAIFSLQSTGTPKILHNKTTAQQISSAARDAIVSLIRNKNDNGG